MTIEQLQAFINARLADGSIFPDTPVTLVCNGQDYQIGRLWPKHSHFTLEARGSVTTQPNLGE